MSNNKKTSWRNSEWFDFLRFAIITCIVIAIIGFAGAKFHDYTTKVDENARTGRISTMEYTIGIVNDRDVSMIVANSINTKGEIEGKMIFFAGSISGKEQDKIRMGYVSPKGNSYIINVPVEKIIFHQQYDIKSSGSFRFNDYIQKNLQYNIDNNLISITVNLTPEEFKQLIQ
ncbi:MAG: hypothetical protein WCJ36_03180 [Candidatus Saccharibacteria bacterium]